MDQAKQYNIQIKAAEKYAVTEVEQRLQYYETQLSPHVNKLENIKRNLGKPQTLNERQIGNLQMAGDSPIIWYKQAYSQANQRAEASVQAFYDLQKSALKIRKLENKTNRSELDDIKLAELKTQYIISQGYVENSITELNQYMATAQRIKEAFNIPDELSDEELDLASIEDHIKQGFKQAIQDITQQGSITKGTFGHLESWGVHPYAAKYYVHEYIANCEHMLKENQLPMVTHLYAFLEDMYQLHKDAYQQNMTRLGI